jgi:hypothetical protein
MRRRSGIAFALASVLGSVVAFTLWQNWGPREPVFEGRTLYSWLDRHVPSSGVNPPYNSPGWLKADKALRQVGSNGIPTLLRMIQAKDPPRPILKVIEWARLRGWVHYRFGRDRNEEAEYAFEVLGTNAASAVPKLIKIYEKNISESSQSCAALALGKIGAAAGPAIPVLLQRFNHTNRYVRFSAVTAVIHIGGDPSIVIPALRGALKDPDVSVRRNAVAGLERFGSRARSAAPDLLGMLNDKGMVGSTSITQHIETALWHIAPDKAGKLCVVEDSTPIIINGITAAPLKAVSDGETNTMIPAGRPVPAIAQYWNSDPRPGLRLYRGTAGKDHFLGSFQVLDVPDTPVNISTLCIIADNRIVLSARDNNRNILLEIRRMENEAKK